MREALPLSMEKADKEKTDPPRNKGCKRDRGHPVRSTWSNRQDSGTLNSFSKFLSFGLRPKMLLGSEFVFPNQLSSLKPEHKNPEANVCSQPLT